MISFHSSSKLPIIYELTRHEMCSEEHQIAIFLSDVINEEMKENEVGRACRYHKCAIKLHTHNDSYNT